MKSKKLWWILFVSGFLPFAIPCCGFAYEMINASSWRFFDYWLFYSFLYWPTYILGFILIIISVIKLKK